MTLLLLALWCIGLAAGRGRRASILAASLLQAPFGFFSVFFVPGYWDPVRIARFGAGPEDLLFSFACGGLAWMVALRTWRPDGLREIEIPSTPWRRILVRYLAWVVPGTAAGALLWWGGLGAMDATVVVSCVAGGLLLLRQRRFHRLALVGAVGFGLLYPAVLKAAFLLWPHFPGQWTHGSMWGLTLIGLPLEEIVWAAGNGAVWPLFVTYLLAAEPAAAPAS